MSTLAWARHLPSGQILHISAARRGLGCECLCPGCGATLEAVNPENPNALRRMHFRHHASAEQTSCLQQAARAALRKVWTAGAEIKLPDYELVQEGRTHDGTPVRVSRRISGGVETIARLDWVDEATGRIELADGRQLTVRIVASAAHVPGTAPESAEPARHAELLVLVDDPALAALAPDELLRRVCLDGSCSRWGFHWQTAQLARTARTELAERLAARAIAKVTAVAMPVGATSPTPAPAAGVHWGYLVWAASRQVTPDHIAAARRCADTICQSPERGALTVDALMSAFDAGIAARGESVRADDWLAAVVAERGERFAAALAAVLVAGRVALTHRSR